MGVARASLPTRRLPFLVPLFVSLDFVSVFVFVWFLARHFFRHREIRLAVVNVSGTGSQVSSASSPRQRRGIIKGFWCSRHLTHFNGGEQQTNQKIALPRSTFTARDSQTTRIFSNELNHGTDRHGSKVFGSHSERRKSQKKIGWKTEKASSSGSHQDLCDQQPLGTSSSIWRAEQSNWCQLMAWTDSYR